MGLDITAYSRLKHVGLHGKWDDEDEHYEKHIQAYAYKSFPQSFRGIPILAEEAHGNTQLVSGGCYVRTDRTETHSFRAGSYGGYGKWREDLAKDYNPAPVTWDRIGPSMAEPDPQRPFYELIWFADNEGTIGPEAAADLLADFREHVTGYAQVHDDYDVARYVDWMRAFELAAGGGLVVFH